MSGVSVSQSDAGCDLNVPHIYTTCIRRFFHFVPSGALMFYNKTRIHHLAPNKRIEDKLRAQR